MRVERRKILIVGLHLPLLGAAGTALGACIDPEELSDSVASMRESLEYTDTAADAKQACNGCSFFKSEKAAASCGNCEVLGGPVSNKGHCVSWTKRA